MTNPKSRCRRWVSELAPFSAYPQHGIKPQKKSGSRTQRIDESETRGNYQFGLKSNTLFTLADFEA